MPSRFARRSSLSRPIPSWNRSKRFSLPSIPQVALCIVFLGINSSVHAQETSVFDSPESARSNPDFMIQGEYTGTNLGLQVIATGDGNFELVLHQGGLPGAGWDRVAPRRFDGDRESVAEFVKSKGLKRVERTSPTLGAKPPKDAVVLFDGTQPSIDAHWKQGARRTEDGLLMQGATTTDTFRDYTMHIEFRTPFQPKAKGQGRGNSGVYHQGRYETQVLDSFGLEGKDNEAGGIYSIRSPDLNMCFPPLAWQTYDVDFTAARYDATGKKTIDALLTVKLNGVVVQRETIVSRITAAAPEKESNTPGPIHLQNHGNPVRFRNIWVVPRDAEKEARRPRIPSFERFYAGTSGANADQVLTSGRMLISQLGCVACHQADAALSELAPKTGPILDRVGSRVRIDHMVDFVTSPHTTKSGTSMPDLFHGLSLGERQEKGEALASFLASTGTLLDKSGDQAAIKRGEATFHTIGCAHCHSPRKEGMKLEGTSVPLGNLTAKYSVDSLSRFLLNPHAVRTSGLMPKLIAEMKEARDVACYLLGESIVGHGTEEFTASIYYGNWDKLPDFDLLKPDKVTKSNGLDLAIAGRSDQFGIRFDSFLPIEVAGTYTFRMGSDDGSRLLIDDKQVMKIDGVHPTQYKNAKSKLEVGVHRLRIEYFEGAGGEELSLEVEGPEYGLTPISLLVTTDESGKLKKEMVPSKFKADPNLVAKGEQLFKQSGCANCHRLQIDKRLVASTIAGKPLNQLRASEGCLAQAVPVGLPDYSLNEEQKQAIRMAMANPKKLLTDEQHIQLTLHSHNCVACHERDGIGGPEMVRDPLFTTKTQEMGNEGRLPPPLTGVGDKLQSAYIGQILVEGAKERPYMLTRMPGFGEGTLVGLRDKLVKVDTAAAKSKGTETKTEPNSDALSNGRKLVGSEGLSCVKCHAYGNKSQGIAAMDMKKMGERLNQDWFARYMREPTRYRPGTRMPLSFPDGKSVLTSIYEGDADRQISAMWDYLRQGKEAKEPIGIDAKAIVLKPDSRPVIYRNFIEGLGPRGIAVGYPELCNLAWDADQMSLSLLWQNEFIDASRHWVGRGQGKQGPLGEFAIPFETESPFAVVSSISQPWPTEGAKARGYKFLGYSLNANGQPTFRYQWENVSVEDSPMPKGREAGKMGFDRKLNLKIAKPTKGLTFRAAVGNIKLASPGVYLLDDKLQIRVEGCSVELVTIDGKSELRGALPESGEVKIIQSLRW